ncbi:MAG: hypothetical protein IKP71_10380, partial [Candidatus Riflebacteria bacterium]|nr:hypothetical protein [Candidatus Riflebacteria bacterium]
MEDQEHEHNHNNESENAHEITCNCGHHHEDDDGESILNCSCGHHHHHENDEGESILNCSCSHHHNHTHNHDDNVHSVGLNSILKVKLNNSIFAIVLLIAGLIYKVIYPEQEQMSQVILAIASVIVAIPVFWSGLIGLFSKESKFMTEQLVSLAILAAMMQKDFIVATVIPIILVFGHFLEEKSIMGIEEAIASLKKLNSKDAIILKDGKESHVELNTLKLDD